jgi:hypothetical protein
MSFKKQLPEIKKREVPNWDLNMGQQIHREDYHTSQVTLDAVLVCYCFFPLLSLF